MIAEKLRQLARATADQVHASRHPAIAQQNRTRRRDGIARSMAADADRLERVQMVLEGLAADHAAGAVPAVLARITNRAQVEALLSYDHRGAPWGDHAERLARIGIAGRLEVIEARVWADNYLRPKSAEQLRAERIRAMESELIGQDIPGFWPTPRSIIDRMITAAQLSGGNCILEPSCGKGDILDALPDLVGGSMVRGVEIRPHLVEICRAKGHDVYCTDFLEWEGSKELWDRIIMNPPFEYFRDADHVRHAYELLAPGGRLVSITGAGLWFRDHPKAVAFRDWFMARDGIDWELPDDAFNTAGAFRRTGVRCKMLTLDK